MFRIVLISFLSLVHARKLLQFQRADLENGSIDLIQFQSVLENDGAFAVIGGSRQYSSAVRELSELAPDCFQLNMFPETLLSDGSIRTTYATNMDKFYPHCIQSVSTAISDEFDSAWSQVAATVEHLLAGQVNLDWKEQQGAPSSKFQSLPHKEHIHVYETTQNSSVSDGASLPFHIDSGILLMLTPSTDLPVQIKGKDGELIDTAEINEDAIIFIVARGLSDWLLQGTSASSKFFPAPHAVPSLRGHVKTRTVFARMMVATELAVPAHVNESPILFEDVFLQKTLRSSGALCPSEMTVTKKLPGTSCPVGSAECWMACLELPECSGNDYYVCTNLVGEPCCNENNSPPPDDGCLDMDTSCKWKCYSDPM